MAVKGSNVNLNSKGENNSWHQPELLVSHVYLKDRSTLVLCDGLLGKAVPVVFMGNPAQPCARSGGRSTIQGFSVFGLGGEVQKDEDRSTQRKRVRSSVERTSIQGGKSPGGFQPRSFLP